MSDLPPSVAWSGSSVRVIDQRLLPGQLVVRDLRTVDEVVEAIATLAVRGANVIGSTGGLGLALGIRQGLDAQATAARIAAARPTAVNLAHAVNRVLVAADPLAAALALLDEDREQCRRIGLAGRAELAGVSTLLTHCNTGKLATTGWGTALGIIYAKQEAGEAVRVLATETRPVRQGARLTAWELRASGIDVTLIPDSAAAAALAGASPLGRVGAVVVGADRIAANGDVANKIGTRALAVAARHAEVPFYVAATLNAVDLATADGAGITIEERSPAEVRDGIPADIPIWNPAFDVTPASLVTAIITEAGVLRPPFPFAFRSVLE